MIDYTAEIIDITRYTSQGLKPVRHIPLNANSVWYVRAKPFDFVARNNDPADWDLIRSGDVVPIPLIPYRSAGCELSHLLLGAMDVMQRYAAAHTEVVRTHVIIGQPIEDLRPEVAAYRFWIGFAAQLH